MDVTAFLPIYDTPGHIIRRAQQFSTAVFEREMAEANVTPTQFGVLRIVCAAPGLEQSEIAGAIYLDPATTGGVLRRLEALGLIRRAPSGRSGRGRSVFPTEQGERLLTRSQEIFRRSRSRLMSNLTEAEQQTMLGLLSKMCGVDNSYTRVAGPAETSPAGAVNW